MGMLDCPKCWDTYCTCGHVWLDFSVERLVEIRNSIQKVIDLKQQPKADENIIHKKSDVPDSGYLAKHGYPTTKPCVVCNTTEKCVVEPMFGYSICEEHKDTNPVEVADILNKRHQ